MRNILFFFLTVAGLSVAIYFGVLIYKQVKPKTYEEKKMECLKLGSNLRYMECLKLINK